MPIRVIVTEGTRADCKERALVNGLRAETLLAERGYDSNEIIKKAVDNGMQAAIPSKRNRKEQRDYDRELYRVRHLVENTFLHLKSWRGIATRYSKRSLSFLAAVQIMYISLLVNII